MYVRMRRLSDKPFRQRITGIMHDSTGSAQPALCAANNAPYVPLWAVTEGMQAGKNGNSYVLSARSIGRTVVDEEASSFSVGDGGVQRKDAS
jgi:hypothetical protein